MRCGGEPGIEIDELAGEFGLPKKEPGREPGRIRWKCICSDSGNVILVRADQRFVPVESEKVAELVATVVDDPRLAGEN